MILPTGPATTNDVTQAARDAWWSLTGRPDAGGGFPLTDSDITAYGDAAIEELAETLRFFRQVSIPGGTVQGVSQYTVPDGVLGVVAALIGGERIIPHLRLAQLDAATHDATSTQGPPRFCHYDRELKRLILFPAPDVGGETLTLIAAVSFAAGADIPKPLLGYVTMRAIERARESRLVPMPDVAQAAGELSETWRKLPT
jgi:hypothetical protein